MTEFQTFWDHYPRKVGKLAALKAYGKARTHATADELLAGVEEYLRHLPEDTCFIPHASTWLNQGRWMDEYDLPRKLPRPRWECPHTPTCNSKTWCACLLERERESA